MTPVNVVGIGLDGATGLVNDLRQLIDRSTLLIGSDRHLSYFPDYVGDRLLLGDIHQTLEKIRHQLNYGNDPQLSIVILVSGDPLFFGLGRLLLEAFPAEQITFHPHVSSVQLAFNRIKIPWQDAKVISVHGRSLDEVTQALQQGIEKIAILTDATNHPVAIARLLLSLDLPINYDFWICENLGDKNERIESWSVENLREQTFSPLNVVVLIRKNQVHSLNLRNLPLLGLPDRVFLTFSDRPGLMTKREVRILALGELALRPGQTVWDVGAGTGTVSIEIARLFPDSQVYAVEKTTAGTSLIEQNCQRFLLRNVISIHGTAPDILHHLPQPDRIFIGGSGGKLSSILGVCAAHLLPGGVVVVALATLEHLQMALTWLAERKHYEPGWEHHLLQVQLSRSIPVGELTRFSPLNPVTIFTAYRPDKLSFKY